MPSSYHQQISKIMDFVIRLNPQSLLDIGAGFGKYGVLCREYLELWDGRYEYSNFKRRIDCIEAFAAYITPIHRYVYDNIYVQDALKKYTRRTRSSSSSSSSFRYDLVLLIDVLEHFEKSTGQSFLHKLLQNNKGVIVSTPKRVQEQGPGFGNKYEIHKAQWTRAELEASSRSCLWVDDENSLICYLSDI